MNLNPFQKQVSIQGSALLELLKNRAKRTAAKPMEDSKTKSELELSKDVEEVSKKSKKFKL